jgi:hypothetical protein
VLEIGGGTGANLPCYGPAVTSLTITEPQPPMLRRLEGSVRARGSSARVPRAPGDCAADDVIDRARGSLQARLGHTRARIDGTRAPNRTG